MGEQKTESKLLYLADVHTGKRTPSRAASLLNWLINGSYSQSMFESAIKN